MTIKIVGLDLSKKEFDMRNGSEIIKLEGLLNLEITQNNINAQSSHNISNISIKARDSLVGALRVIEDELNGVDLSNIANINQGENTKELQSQVLKLKQEYTELQERYVKLQLEYFEDKRKCNVNMDTNKWITGSSTGDTIKEILDKEFDSAKDIVIGGIIDFKDAMIKIPKGEFITPKSDSEKLLKQLDVEKEKLESIKKQKEELEEKIHSHNTDKDESEYIGKVLDEAGKIFNVVFNINEETKKSTQDLAKDMAKEMRTRGMWK